MKAVSAFTILAAFVLSGCATSSPKVIDLTNTREGQSKAVKQSTGSIFGTSANVIDFTTQPRN